MDRIYKKSQMVGVFDNSNEKPVKKFPRSCYSTLKKLPSLDFLKTPDVL